MRSIVIVLFLACQKGLAQGYFDLHNHLNLYGYLTDKSFTDPLQAGYVPGPGVNGKTLSWTQLQNSGCSAQHKLKKGKQANFDGYTQTSLSLLKTTPVNFVVNSLYSLEKDLYDQWIVRKWIGKFISGIRDEKAGYLGYYSNGGRHNHPSMYNDLMGLYHHQRHHFLADPAGKRTLEYPTRAVQLTDDSALVQVMYSVEGVHSLMDHSPLEYLRSVRGLNGMLALDMHDAKLGRRHQDTAFSFLYTDRMVHRNFQETYHTWPSGAYKVPFGFRDECHSQHYTFFHRDMPERDKILYRLIDMKTNWRDHPHVLASYQLPDFFSEGRLLYLTFSHFLNNKVVKQADVLDHKCPLFQELINKAIKMGTFPGLNAFSHMRKAGSAPFSPLGMDILKLCMDVNLGFPVAVDVKHMDATTRSFLYRYIDKKDFSQPDSLELFSPDSTQTETPQKVYLRYTPHLPLICSHAGVSMLPTLMEAELLERMLDSGQITNRRAGKEAGRSGNKGIDREGMLYPLPINLTDEDISHIAASGGIVGFNLDERILGTSIKRYKRRHRRRIFNPEGVFTETGNPFLKAIDSLVQATLPSNYNTLSKRKQRKAKEELMCRYRGIEPLLRNVMHTIWVIESDRLNHPSPVSCPDMVCSAPDPAPPAPLSHSMSFVCLGTDFDGIIDPLDPYKTVSELPRLKADLETFLPYYFRLDPDRHTRDLLKGINLHHNNQPLAALIDQISEGFFSGNGRAFVRRLLTLDHP